MEKYFHLHLKPEEESYFLKRLKYDESIKSILIERNLRLVVYIARKFENTGVKYRRFDFYRNYRS